MMILNTLAGKNIFGVTAVIICCIFLVGSCTVNDGALDKTGKDTQLSKIHSFEDVAKYIKVGQHSNAVYDLLGPAALQTDYITNTISLTYYTIDITRVPETNFMFTGFEVHLQSNHVNAISPIYSGRRRIK